MPTYEYKCLDCDRRFEVFQNMTDEPLTECEICSGKLKRLIGTGAGIIFKGSGFYATDYRSSSYQQAASKEKSQAKSPSDSSKEKSDSGTTGKADATSGTSGSSGSAKENKKP